MTRRLVWFVRRREWFTAGVGHWSLTVIWHLHCWCWFWLAWEPAHRTVRLGPLVVIW